MSEWNEIVDAVIDHVKLLKEMGELSVPVDPATLAALEAARNAKPSAPRPAPVAASSAAPAGMPPPSAFHAVPPPAAVPVPPGDRAAALAAIAARAEVCDACPLRANRTKLVPGQGNPNSPDVMFIGEAPGADEDLAGLAFVGAAGKLLTKMIAAMGYTREQVFIANICKCRPPHNRTPVPEEMAKCLPFLREQIGIIKPKTIVLLGGTAIRGLLNQSGVMRLQGQWTVYEGIPVMPTFHPAYLLRFAPNSAAERQAKLQVWRALKLVLKQVGKDVPGEKKA